MQARRSTSRTDEGPVRRLHSLCDIADYSRLVSDAQRDQQQRLSNLQRIAARYAGLDREAAYIQHTGDGELVRWPAYTDELKFAVDYPRELQTELVRINRDLAEHSRMRLRVAITSGFSQIADTGLAGDAPVRVARLVNARQAREALNLDPGRALVVVFDDRLFHDVVKQELHGLHPEDFVHIVVREKGFVGDAWLYVPDGDRSKLAMLAEPIARPEEHSPQPQPQPPAPRPTPISNTVDDPSGPFRWLTRSWNRMNSQVKVAVIGAVGAVAAASITAAFSLHPTAASPPPNTPTNSPSNTPVVVTSSSPLNPTQTPSPSVSVPSVAARGLIAEWTDNRLGTPVFRDPLGDAVNGQESIPFDTKVMVKCWADNQSGMGSVNAFYLVETAPWTNEYAPANTFANGDPIGGQGSTAIDSAVPHC